MTETFASVISQVARLLRRDFDEKARGKGVTRPQWQVLAILAGSPGINQGALADLLEVEPITAGRMIDRMQDAALVERRADPADRRVWRLYLTSKGQGLLEDLRPPALDTIEAALDGLDERQRADLMTSLNHIRCNLSRREPTPQVAGQHG